VRTPAPIHADSGEAIWARAASGTTGRRASTMHRAVMREVYRSLGAEKSEQGIENFIGLFAHEVVAGGG